MARSCSSGALPRSRILGPGKPRTSIHSIGHDDPPGRGFTPRQNASGLKPSQTAPKTHKNDQNSPSFATFPPAITLHFPRFPTPATQRLSFRKPFAHYSPCSHSQSALSSAQAYKCTPLAAYICAVFRSNPHPYFAQSSLFAYNSAMDFQLVTTYTRARSARRLPS